MFKSSTDYIRQTFAPETPEMRRARESLADPNDRIHISPQDGKLLHVLAKLADARRIVEIGTLGGYSALWLASALPPGGELVTIEKEERRAQTARANTAHDTRIRVMTGDALDVLSTLQGPFDMAFIDADKIAYPGYLDGVEKLVRRGGLIAADNTFLFDSVWHDAPVERVRETARKAMRAFNARLADPAKYAGILVPTKEGLTVAVKLT